MLVTSTLRSRDSVSRAGTLRTGVVGYTIPGMTILLIETTETIVPAGTVEGERLLVVLRRARGRDRVVVETGRPLSRLGCHVINPEVQAAVFVHRTLSIRSLRSPDPFSRYRPRALAPAPSRRTGHSEIMP
jgi:hypothetical protein